MTSHFSDWKGLFQLPKHKQCRVLYSAREGLKTMNASKGIIIMGTICEIYSYLAKELNPFPNRPLFLCVFCRFLSKTLWEKEKLLVTSNFSFPRSVFYPFGELSTIFIKFKIWSANSVS